MLLAIRLNVILALKKQLKCRGVIFPDIGFEEDDREDLDEVEVAQD